MQPRFVSMPVGLAVGVTLAAVVASSAGAYVYSRHHFESMLRTARETALAKGELMRAALEHQMMENERALIARMIESFAGQPSVERVALHDRGGVERFASGPLAVPEPGGIGAPTCQACHQLPPEQRSASLVIETRGGGILRTVVAVHNRPACHGCHNPAHRINGVLILDYNIEATRNAMASDVYWMAGGTAALTLLLVGGIAWVVRVFVLRRLQRFETAARQIAAGDLARRVPAGGADTLGWLAREFNSMADSMTQLVGEVRSERERLETVINSIDDGIVVLDPERRIIAANDAFLARSSRGREHVLGACCRDLPPGVCTVADCPSLSCLHSGESQVRICERRTADGEVAWEEVHASPIRDAEGRLTQVVEVWRDISGRRKAEAQLAESHRLASLGLLASGFSHELNTPLATVLTCVEGILRATPAADGGAEAELIRGNAAIAREQLLRCRGITQHFLRMSRSQKPAEALVDVARAIAAAGRLIAPTAREHGVQIELPEAPEGLHVRADEAALQHVLINLLLNAVQASEAGSRVTVTARRNAQVHIRITDQGCGIPAEHRRRIFEPFFGLRKGGTGLGLFLSLDFVRRWGGDIEVESEPGRGSSFEITLPAAGEGGTA